LHFINVGIENAASARFLRYRRALLFSNERSGPAPVLCGILHSKYMNLKFTSPSRVTNSAFSVNALMFVAFSFVGAVVAVLTGAFLGIGFYMPVLAIVAAILAPALYLVGAAVFDRYMHLVLLVPPALTVALSLLASVTGVVGFFVLELCLIAASIIALPRLQPEIIKSTISKILAVILAAYFFVVCLSSYFGDSTLLSSVYQIFTNLKLVLLVAIGFQLSLSKKVETWFCCVVRYFWIPLLVAVLFQIGAKGMFETVFPYAATNTLGSFGINPRAVGLFKHPTYLGFYGMMLGVSAAALFMKTGRIGYLVSLVFYLLLIYLAGQRNEFVAALLVAGLVWMFMGRRTGLWMRMSLTSVVVLGVLGFGLSMYRTELFEAFLHSDISAGYRAVQPRSVLYFDALGIAFNRFPLGSGLGTFGSAASMNFNPALYFQLGFQSFGWFGTNVLLDTYWAQHIAEPGFLGFAFFASFVLLAFAFVARRFILDGVQSHFFVVMGFATFCATFLISLTSPAFEDPGLMWMPALLFGAGFRQAVLSGQCGRARVCIDH